MKYEKFEDRPVWKKAEELYETAEDLLGRSD
jgi:hypothetical protein